MCTIHILIVWCSVRTVAEYLSVNSICCKDARTDDCLFCQVEILVGKDKGKQGLVNCIIKERNWVYIEGLNCVCTDFHVINQLAHSIWGLLPSVKLRDFAKMIWLYSVNFIEILFVLCCANVAQSSKVFTYNT